MTTVAELRTEFTANFGKLQSSLNQVKGQLQSTNARLDQFEKTGRKLKQTTDQTAASMNKATVAARRLVQALAIGAVVKFTFDAIKAAASLDTLSQRTGISVENLSGLQFAMAQVGADFRQLDQLVVGFASRLREGLTNNLSQSSLALGALGLSARDTAGNIKNLTDFLPELADKFAVMQDGIGKTQIAAALFGEEAGPKLIPLLNQGSAGIEDLTRKARELGLVLNQEAARRAREFEAATGTLFLSVQRLTQELALLAAPAMTKVINNLVLLISELNKASAANKELGDVTANVAAARLEELSSQLMRAALRQTELRDSVLASSPQIVQEWSGYSKEVAAVSDQIAKLTAEFERLSGVAGRVGQNIPIIAGPQIGGASDVFRAPQEDLLKAQFDAVQRARAQFQQLAELAQGGGTVVPLEMFGGMKTQLDQLSMAFTSQAEIVEQAQARIRAAYGDTAQATQALTQFQIAQSQRYEQAIFATGQAAAGAIQALWPKQKAGAYANAVVNTAQAITEALKQPYPLNFILASAVGIAGAAQIAAISGTNLGGGGSVPSPTGGGGSASPAPQAVPEAPSTQAVTIQLRGADRFTGAQVADIIDQLNDATKNGKVLIATEILR